MENLTAIARNFLAFGTVFRSKSPARPLSSVIPMAKADKVLRVLLVEDSVEDAEQVISLLRNAGIAVRPNRVDNAEQLKAALEAGSTDVVLLSPKVKNLGLAETASVVHRSGKDMSLIQLLDTITQDAVLKAMREGARDVALRSSTRCFLTEIVECRAAKQIEEKGLQCRGLGSQNAHSLIQQ